MPPLIGYAAAGHGIDAGALALFLILFVWQFPHFDAIAWMYRDDYARGGIRMLPVVDPDGESTARRILVCSVLLIPISLVPLFLGMTGAFYAAAALIAGFGVLYFGARMGRKRNLASAHALLLATVFYLPTLFGVMVLDRKPVRPNCEESCVVIPPHGLEKTMNQSLSADPAQPSVCTSLFGCTGRRTGWGTLEELRTDLNEILGEDFVPAPWRARRQGGGSDSWWPACTVLQPWGVIMIPRIPPEVAQW